jgi:hypothetical protein
MGVITGNPRTETTMQKIIGLFYLVKAKLEGKKTYIIAFVTAGLNLAVAFNWVSVDNLSQINVILVALGGAAIRAGIDKVE